MIAKIKILVLKMSLELHPLSLGLECDTYFPNYMKPHLIQMMQYRMLYFLLVAYTEDLKFLNGIGSSVQFTFHDGIINPYSSRMAYFRFKVIERMFQDFPELKQCRKKESPSVVAQFSSFGWIARFKYTAYLLSFAHNLLIKYETPGHIVESAILVQSAKLFGKSFLAFRFPKMFHVLQESEDGWPSNQDLYQVHQFWPLRIDLIYTEVEKQKLGYTSLKSCLDALEAQYPVPKILKNMFDKYDYDMFNAFCCLGLSVATGDEMDSSYNDDKSEDGDPDEEEVSTNEKDYAFLIAQLPFFRNEMPFDAKLADFLRFLQKVKIVMTLDDEERSLGLAQSRLFKHYLVGTSGSSE